MRGSLPVEGTSLHTARGYGMVVLFNRVRIGFIIIVFFLCTGVAAGEADVVINEVMYHPPDTAPLAEFVELYNAGDAACDLSGWRFTKGVEFVFSEGVVIEADSYLVVCRDISAFQAAYGTDALIAGRYERGLNNAGEKIRLKDHLDLVVQEMDYLDVWPWDPDPDGAGPSLELIQPGLDPDDPYSWRSSVNGPTPGAENSVYGRRFPLYLSEPHHIPDKPLPDEEVTIQVQAHHQAPLEGVTLFYEVLLKNENSGSTGALAMRDDGSAPDAQAGDDIWTCTLPGRPEYTLVRYYFIAEDENGLQARLPHPEAETTNRAYFVAPGIESNLKTWWLIMTPSAYSALESHIYTDEREPAAFVSDTGKVYDRITVRYRGARARHTAKKSWKVVFNSDRLFRDQKRINLNAEAFDPALLREKVGYDIFEEIGAVSLQTELVRVHFTRAAGSTGTFLGLFTAIEQADSRWVRRIDRNNAVVYKSFSRSNRGDERYESNHNVYFEHYDKETHEDEPWTDFIRFTDEIDGLFGASEAVIKSYFEDNVSLPSFYAYMVANACMQNWDQFNKNHYMLFDLDGSGKWEMTPWDVDRILGDHWNGSFDHYTLTPYLGRQADPGVTGWNRVMDRFLAVRDFREAYMEQLRQALLTSFTEAKWLPHIDELSGQMADAADLDDQKWGGNWRSAVEKVKAFITNRRTWLLQTYFPGDPPEAPVAVSPVEGQQIQGLPFTLRASHFSHPEDGIVHLSSRWQITEDGDGWSEAVVDVVSFEGLTDYTVSQTVFEEETGYLWRVSYTANNGGVSSWSEPALFSTGDFGYVITQFDLGPYFNRDVVVNVGDGTNDPFDAGDCSMIEEGYRGGDGLPVDGEVGDYLLGDYSHDNSIQLGEGSASVAVEVAPALYIGLNFLAASGNGDADVHVVLRYQDGSEESTFVRTEDWFNDNLPAAINDMDRICGGSMHDANNPGLFVWNVSVDHTRVLEEVVLDPDGALSSFSGGNTLFNLMALNGIEMRSGAGFIRGDANEDLQVDLSDPIVILLYLFNDRVPPECMDRLDANDDGAVDITDPVYLLSYLFNGGAPPPAPFPGAGSDVTEDDLPCSL